MHRPTQEDRQLLATVEHVRSYWPGWDRVLVGASVLFHGLLASAMAFAPYNQIYNAGTAPVYEIASRYVWALAFTVAAVASALLVLRQTMSRLVITWFTVLPLGGLWWTAFVVAVANGRGSAIGVAVWLVLYGIWAIVALRMALGKR